MRNRRIDYRNIPPTTRKFWAMAEVWVPTKKVPVCLRLDADIVDWFKRRGAGYQTRINAVLRAYLELVKPQRRRRRPL